MALLIITVFRKLSNRNIWKAETKGGYMYEKYAKLRDDRNLTDYAVANQTGIAPSTLSDWKNGKTVPKSNGPAQLGW